MFEKFFDRTYWMIADKNFRLVTTISFERRWTLSAYHPGTFVRTSPGVEFGQNSTLKQVKLMSAGSGRDIKPVVE